MSYFKSNMETYTDGKGKLHRKVFIVCDGNGCFARTVCSSNESSASTHAAKIGFECSGDRHFCKRCKEKK